MTTLLIISIYRLRDVSIYVQNFICLHLHYTYHLSYKYLRVVAALISEEGGYTRLVTVTNRFLLLGNNNVCMYVCELDTMKKSEELSYI